MRKLVSWQIASIILGVGTLGLGRLALAQSQPAAWSVGVMTSLTSFRGAARTAGADSVSVRPGQGISLGLAVTRRWNPWAVSIGIDYLPTRLEAVAPDFVVQDRTGDLERVRLLATLSRRVARLGTGALELRLSPALDTWTAGNEDRRTVVAGEVALAAALPVGPCTLENTLGIGWSPGPFRATELPAGYERRSLRTIRAGIGLSIGH